MTQEEFLKKATETRDKLKEIISEIKVMDGYIYHQQQFVKVYDWINEHLREMEYYVKYWGDRIKFGQNIPSATIEECSKEYDHYVLLDTNMLNELKEIRFVAPR